MAGRKRIKFKDLSVTRNLSTHSSIKGKFEIGDSNTVNWGPTSETGYYAAAIIPDGGHILYNIHSDGTFDAYVADDTEELIRKWAFIKNSSYASYAAVSSSVNSEANWFLDTHPSASLSSGNPWNIDNCIIAYSALDSSGYDSSYLYNLASVNSHLSMSLGGSPTVSNGVMTFDSNDYAVGNYDDFVDVLPNQDNSTHTTDFTYIAVFDGDTTSTRALMFEMGHAANIKLGYQYSGGGNFTTTITDRSGVTTAFTQGGSRHYYAGDGVNIVSSEANNRWVGRMGMLGVRGTYRSGTSDYLLQEIVDGKRTSLWSPPPNVTVEEEGAIDWRWRDNSWAVKKPTINANTTTGTPNPSGNSTKFKGLYFFDRALTDDEIQSIWDAHE